MKVMRVIRYILWTVVFAIGGYAVYVLWSMRNRPLQTVTNVETMLFLEFFVFFPCLLVAVILQKIEESMRWKAFMGPLKMSFERDFAIRWRELQPKLTSLDKEALYAAVAITSFNEAWRQNVGDKKVPYCKSNVAEELIGKHAKQLKVKGDLIPAVLVNI